MTNKGDSMHKVLIHGENVFIPVDKLPKGEVTKHKMFIAGHSETGHHHVLVSETEFDVIDDAEKQELFIRLFQPAKVVHQKNFEIHETKTLEPGLYKRIFATEYDPFAKVVRRIFDWWALYLKTSTGRMVRLTLLKEHILKCLLRTR